MSEVIEALPVISTGRQVMQTPEDVAEMLRLNRLLNFGRP